MTKRCPKCGRDFPATLEHFYASKQTKDGLFGWCKECAKAKSREWQQSHYCPRPRTAKHQTEGERLEANRESARRWKANNRDAVLAYGTAWRLAHPTYGRDYYLKTREQQLSRQRERYYADHEASKAKMQAWKAKHADRMREQRAEYADQNRARAKAWRTNNRSRYLLSHRASQAARRARTVAAGGSYTASDVDAQFKRQRGKCYWQQTEECRSRKGKLDRGDYHVDHVIPLSRGGGNGPDNIVIACPECNLTKHNLFPHEFALKLC